MMSDLYILIFMINDYKGVINKIKFNIIYKNLLPFVNLSIIMALKVELEQPKRSDV